MAFPAPLTSKMSGASSPQLAAWRRNNALRPETGPGRSLYLYSFRDIVALRVAVRYGAGRSLRSIRESLATLPLLDLAEHPAEYELVKAGSSILVASADRAIEIRRGKNAATQTIGTLSDVFDAFDTRGTRSVEAFLRPTKHLAVHPGRHGGWPTIAGTRVPYDAVATLMADGDVEAERVWRYYPGVTTEAAEDALDYHRSVVEAARPASARAE